MSRRILRTALKLAIGSSFLLLTVTVLNRNYKVLPKAIQAYLPQHHQGHVVTDITVAECSSVNPFSSCEMNPEIWHRIDKDLFLGRTWTKSGYLHVRRVKDENLMPDDLVVTDISVGRLDPNLDENLAGLQGKWESRAAGLWVKRSSRKDVVADTDVVTSIDVLFGDDAVEAREGWTITGTPLMLGAGSDVPSAHLTMRRGPQTQHKKPQPRIRENGRFRIMQIADLHLSTGVGECRDAIPDSYNGAKCEADPRTLDFVTKMLDEERPDFVVLTGDQVNGDTAPDAQTAIFKYASLLIKRQIPYVTLFGNHDDEKTLSREAQMAIVESLPFSLSEAGPEEVDGVGNYVVEILGRGSSDHSALTLYMLDTHAYSPNEKKFPGYDWIKPNQIEWFKKKASGLKAKHSEYTHVHMDLAFIHIPLPEYLGPDRFYKGEWREYVTAPMFNSGFRDALVEQGIVMVSCGHDHVNDYCMLSTEGENERPALWMCYGGGVGFGGYAGYGGYTRRLRMFEVDTNEGRITTWKRLEHGENVDKRIDEQIIVDAGRPTPAPPPEE